MSAAANFKKSIFLLLAAILIAWLYSWINMRLWQQELQYKIEQLSEHKPKELQQTQSNESLAITDIALPALPALPALTSKTETIEPAVVAASLLAQEPPQIPQQVSNVLTEQPVVEPTSEPVSYPKAELPVTQAAPLQRALPRASLKTQATTLQVPAPVKHQSAQEVYQQLQSDQSLDLQIALPQNTVLRNQLLSYLYRCAGVQFAVLQQQRAQQKQQELNYLSPKRYVPVSQWLRVANGALSPQEQQWLKNKKGTAIRLFPQSIDQRLSHYLATTLQGKNLTSLRASYSLTASGLVLTNIELNNQSIKESWLLHHSQCVA